MSKQRFTFDNVDNRFRTTNLTGTTFVDENLSGAVFIITVNAITFIHLPKALPGRNFCVYVAVDMEDSLVIAQVPGERFNADLRYVDKDSTLSSFGGGSTTEGYIRFNGQFGYSANTNNRGRLQGTFVEIRCFVLGEWHMTGTLVGSGTIETPFRGFILLQI